MGIRQYKPVTPGRRQGTVSDFADITDRKKKPEKSSLQPEAQEGRPEYQGIIHTVPWRRSQQMYRVIDFKRIKDDMPGDGDGHRVRPESLRPHCPD